MEKLPNPHLSKLKAMAQLMEPLLKVGKAGLSEAFLGVANEALERHELRVHDLEREDDHDEDRHRDEEQDRRRRRRRIALLGLGGVNLGS